MKYAIVAIGYNRLHGYQRLLNSLLKATYYGESVDLILSLDFCEKKEVLCYSQQFKWPFGRKIVRCFNVRQGLKKHILSCGDFLNEYDAVAVFEDDIVVSPSFYSFMREAVPFYCNDSRIAGISLFSYYFNISNKLPFIPAKQTGDVYFMQLAQSWGQIWLKKQFLDFLKWIKETPVSYTDTTSDFINSWPDNSSWLKLHIKYCVDNNKFFVYPYYGFTTCFSDVGTHATKKQNECQIPFLISSDASCFKFAKLSISSVAYDCFFERIFFDNLELLVDLYGTKAKQYPRFKKILTCSHLNYKIMDSYALEFRPHEMNYVYNVSGDDFFLYNSEVPQKFKKKSLSELHKFMYYYSFYNHFEILPKVFTEKIKEKIFKK